MTLNNEEFLRKTITEFVQNSPDNRMSNLDGGPYFDEPLVGFSDGGDPLYAEYKSIIGDFHMAPKELLEMMIQDGDASPNQDLGNMNVVSYVLPVTPETRRSNRPQDYYPSIQWAHMRQFGEEFNMKLRGHLVSAIREKGYMALAPHGSKYFKMFNEVLASNWSERHACYVAGLGTFGLSDGFITPVGIAHRCGSVVTNMEISPSPREAENHYWNCLHFREDTCRKCVDRCPTDALTKEGHDKAKCYHQVYTVCLNDKREEYGVTDATGCGLCQVAVPCEAGVPKSLLPKN